MLFEIDGIGAHEEDGWLGAEVRIGEARVVFNGDVGRCVVTSRDPDTGVADLATLATLAAYRPEGKTERLPFGIYGAVVVPGQVRVGDAVVPSASARSRTRRRPRRRDGSRAGGLLYKLAGAHMGSFGRMRGEHDSRMLTHAQPRGREEGNRQRKSHAVPFAVEPQV